MRRRKRKRAEKLDEGLQSRELVPREERELEFGARGRISGRARGDDFCEQLRELFGAGFDQPRLRV
jgi:hypothetical protein